MTKSNVNEQLEFQKELTSLAAQNGLHLGGIPGNCGKVCINHWGRIQYGNGERYACELGRQDGLI